MTAPVGRRERKRVELRDRLYTAAIDLFVRHGFDATTMDDIAARADVARATVFNHYPQKRAFLEEWGQRRRSAVGRVVADNLPADEQLARYLEALAGLNQASRAATTTLMPAAARAGRLLQEPGLDHVLASIVRQGVRERLFRSDVDAEQVGALLAAGYLTAVLRWVDVEPEPFDLPDHLSRMLDLVLRGLRR